MYKATKTLAAINSALEYDQGAIYRYWLEKVLPHIGDAYSTDTFPFRSHLGASIIGSDCYRKCWYSFRWAKYTKVEGRMLRLFNRGHLEEGRFIALLLMIGVEVYQQDENGKQFRISHANGHAGGSGDGVGIGVPDLDPGQPCLLEFKTSSTKYFGPIKQFGVKKKKPEHYIQMQLYLHKMGLASALYMIVDKNTDEIHAEIVSYDRATALQYFDKMEQIVNATTAPKRIKDSPSWFQCNFCDYKAICHYGKQPDKNCRTCSNSVLKENGMWLCNLTGSLLDKHDQLKGCEKYSRLL